MLLALQRGSVVLSGKRYGIVWQVEGDRLSLLPVVPPGRRRHAYDVELTFPELLAAGIALPDATVRCGHPIEVAADGQTVVGQVAGQLTCRITIAVARNAADVRSTEIWEDDRRHRARARAERPVRMSA